MTLVRPLLLFMIGLTISFSHSEFQHSARTKVTPRKVRGSECDWQVRTQGGVYIAQPQKHLQHQ